MNIWSSGTNRTTYDNGKFQFITNNQLRLEITMEDDNCVVNLMGNGTINSNGDLRLYLDKNQAASNQAAELKVFNGLGHEVFSVNEKGETRLNSGDISTQSTAAGAMGNDHILRIGRGLAWAGRGQVSIRNQAETNDPEFGNQPKKAGILVLYDENGNDHFLWVDTAGKLRISGSDPGTNDVTGAVVGLQN